MFALAALGAGALLYKYVTREPEPTYPTYSYSTSRTYRSYDLDYYYGRSSSSYQPSTSTSTSTSYHSNKPESSYAGSSYKNETVRPKTNVVRSLSLTVIDKQSNWNSMPANCEKQLVALATTHSEYIEIMNLFHSKMPRSRSQISRIERVQNPYLMGRYQMKKNELKTRLNYVQELLLFHGTKAVNVDKICEDNFNWRLNGQGTGHRFGQGVSFSAKSCYSENYCDKGKKGKRGKVMIVAKVMIGVKCVGHGNMVIPDYYDKVRKIRFDTTVKDVKNNDVIVKYSDDEFYPAYVIHFTAEPRQQNYKKPSVTVSTYPTYVY